MEKQQFIAKTFLGLEDALQKELADLGATDFITYHRTVIFYGDKKLMYKANFWCRTALRILMPIKEFKARNTNDLYRKLYNFNWTEYLSLDTTFAVDSVANGPNFKHSKYAALKCKDAIVDSFRDKTGKRPSVSVENPDVRINLYINDDGCVLSLDSSGSSLHRRGYRLENSGASLNEVLAAGMVLYSGWDATQPLYDPMCGSGTIPIEAAFIGANIAPGLLRKSFGFQTWFDYDNKLFREITEEARALQNKEKFKIYASDIFGKNLQITRDNAKRAGVVQYLEIEKLDFFEMQPQTENGILIMNPPYGERLKQDNILEFYEKIGDTFKKNWQGFTAWIISSNFDGLKKIRLKASRKIKLYNGSLDCNYQRYEMYSGSRKHKYDK